MKEEYLHFLWRMRCVSSRNMKLSNGQEIEIIDFGEYNRYESGPDFFQAKLLIEGILWCGSVEFHIKSSDWHAHGHHNDSAYENVILHIVWQEDREIINNGSVLPTLLISNYIQLDHCTNIERTQKEIFRIPCNYSLHEVEFIFHEKEKEIALHNRFLRKTTFLKQTESEGHTQVLYELLATAFGAKVNKDPFWELTRRIPIKRLLRLNKKKRVELIYYTSGLVFDKNELDTTQESPTQMMDWQWKRKGLFPKGFPEIRIKQFAGYIEHFDFDFGFLELTATELLNYLEKSFSLVDSSVEFSKSFKHLIIMNSFVTFIWWLGETKGEFKWQNLAYELLQILPPENNHITKLMKNAGFQMNSAYDSQALIEIHNQQCTRKKCLTCGIGIKILSR